ncbi:MAG: methylcobalamin:coenzyme M methyltransferase [Lentisphaerae bacterium ADurb.BinA184]|nr:MAG: methylcobalamin:coenzyme M methyltransferase [Lentisphaerae bacterium ADurb.BinA184]
MNSRERVFLALAHRPADRIPSDFWATPTVVRTLEAALHKPYAQFLDDCGVDFRYIEGPAYIGPPLPPGTDIWGVGRTAVAAGAAGRAESYSDVVKPPLSDAATPGDVGAYDHWPNPDLFDYSTIGRQCDQAARGDRVVVFMGDRLNRIAQLKPAMYLRGPENIFLDLAVRPEMAHAILGRIREFYLAYLERILAAAAGRIAIVLTGDDFGAQNGLLLSPGMWREFLRPGFADYVSLIKSRGAVAMHHTCGAVADIVPDLIAGGLDVLQSLQPEARGMSLASLKKRFGRRLCFHGGVSIQKTMPYGSRDDIRREVRAIANTVGQDGGYIFCTSHNIQADTPIDNVMALMEAYLEFGTTPQPGHGRRHAARTTQSGANR